MSLLSWLFPRKNKTPARLANASAPPQSALAAVPKDDRAQRRERLYLAVRDAMVRSGVLSSGYKFKVLSLDTEGYRFLVMIDLAPNYAADTARQGEMEALLVQIAQKRFRIEVTAVYWRVNDMLGAADRSMVTTPVAPLSAPDASKAAATVAADAPAQPRKPGFEPIAPDEVEAFKQALQKPALPTGSVAAPAQAPRAELLERDPPATGSGNGFADTMIVGQDAHLPRLGSTQYGEMR